MIDKDGRETNALYANIGKIITSSLELDKVLAGIMDEVQLYFAPENWSLIRLDHESRQLTFVILEGADLNEVGPLKLELGEGIAGVVAQTGESIFVPDTSKDSRFSDRVDNILGFKTSSIIAVPLLYNDEVFGVLEIINRQIGKNFTEEEHLVLKTVADFSAIAIYNSLLYEKVLSQSITDSLTGLYNHLKLNSIIEEWEQLENLYRRIDDGLAEVQVVYLDLNDFKTINDRFGHREGDSVLVEAGKELNRIVRNEDLVFRIGGDEFLALVKISPKDDLHAAKERLAKQLAAWSYSNEAKDYSIGFSFGITVGPVNQVKELINRADKEMLAYKKEHKFGR
ncbi:MAG: sensor domain-containing diguanylate cyclase [bacterium]|nr:sensor domain-containing diguanylate cyclase [bacterium]